MDWFIARNGKPQGPLTFQAMLDAVRRGELGPDDYVWQPGSDFWKRADDIVTLSPVPPPRRTLPWRWAAVVGLVVSGAAMLVLLPSFVWVESDPPRASKRDCPFNDYVQGRCR